MRRAIAGALGIGWIRIVGGFSVIVHHADAPTPWDSVLFALGALLVIEGLDARFARLTREAE